MKISLTKRVILMWQWLAINSVTLFNLQELTPEKKE